MTNLAPLVLDYQESAADALTRFQWDRPYIERQSGNPARPTHWFMAGQVPSTALSMAAAVLEARGVHPQDDPTGPDDTAASLFKGVFYFLDPEES
jgi:hypothetical protein